jgi:hypothetical protein
MLQFCVMKATMFHLLIILLFSLDIKAQNSKTMKDQGNAKGEMIKKGKLIYTEIRINAPVKKVWSIFTDFEKYPEWNPFIKSLKESPIERGKIKVFLQPPGKRGMHFEPKVLKFENEKEFRWIGKLFIPRIFDGEHTFILKDNKDGTCTFMQYERFRGLLVPFMKNMLENNTKNGFELMNKALKKRCE